MMFSRWRATVLDIAKRLFLNRRQLRSESCSKLIAMEADNVSHLQHEDLMKLQVLHQLVQWIDNRVSHLPRQMRVELRRTGAAMAQILLDDAQVHASFK